MPIIELPDKGIEVEFPDSMSEQEISAAIKKQFYTPKAQAAGHGYTGSWDTSSATKELGRGFMEGLMSTPETIGTITKIAGAKKAGKAIEDFSKSVSDDYRMPAGLQGSVVKDPSLLAEPAWWTHSIGQVAGSFVGPVGAGGTAAKATMAILNRVIRNPKTVAKAAKYIGIRTAGAFGGTMEGSQTYNQVLEETGDEKKALRSGILMAIGSAVLNSSSFGNMLTPKVKSKLLHVVTSGIMEGATEQLEEPWEALVTGKPEEAVQRWIDGFNVFLPSMVVGGLGGGAGLMSTGGSKDAVFSKDERDEINGALSSALKDEAIPNVLRNVQAGMNAVKPVQGEGFTMAPKKETVTRPKKNYPVVPYEGPEYQTQPGEMQGQVNVEYKPLFSKRGTPYRTEAAARKAAARTGAEVVPVEGGFAVQERGRTIQGAEVQPQPGARPSLFDKVKSEQPATQEKKPSLFEKKASVKMMLTQKDKADLKGLGYTDEQISAMKPEEGQKIIEGKIQVPLKPLSEYSDVSPGPNIMSARQVEALRRGILGLKPEGEHVPEKAPEMPKVTEERPTLPEQPKPASGGETVQAVGGSEGKKAPWEMTEDEWLNATRFYRSGKTKNVETPSGTRAILKQESTQGNYRETSRDFLMGLRSNDIAKAIKQKPQVIPGIEGTEVHIAKHEKGFSVAVKDTDSGEFLPAAKIFPTYEKAKIFADSVAQGKEATKPTEQKQAAKPELTIEDYSDKSIVVRGNTKDHKDRIKQAGRGRFNLRLKGGPGWIFQKTQEAKVRESLGDLIGEAQKEQPKPEVKKEVQEPIGHNEEGTPIHLDKDGNRTVKVNGFIRSAPRPLLSNGGVLKPYDARQLHKTGRTEFLTKEEVQGFEAEKKPSLLEKKKEAKPAAKEDLSKKTTGELVTDIFAIINDHIGNRGSFSTEMKEIDETLYQKLKPYLKEIADRAKAKALDMKAYLFGAVDSMPDGKAKDVYGIAASRYIEDIDTGENAVIIDKGESGNEPTTTVTSREGEGAAADDRNRVEGQSTENLPGAESEGQSPVLPAGSRKGNDGELRSGSRESQREGIEHEEQESESGSGVKHGTSQRVGRNTRNVARIQRSGEGNYRIKPGAITREGSWKTAAQNNLDAIEIAKTLEKENRPATPEEQDRLAKFVGWGASDLANKMFPGFTYGGEVKASWADADWKPYVERMVSLLSPEEIKTAARSTQYAHYTSEPVIRAIYNALDRFGFSGGRILEPGMGIGHFAGLIPDSMNNVSIYTGIEMDHVTAAIAKALYPGHNVIQGDFTKEKFPKNFFDLAIGNPPFSDTVILADPEYKKQRFMLHDYFFAKSIDRVRPGGLLVFITSKGTMDKVNDRARQYFSERADLVGAIRMPQTAFKQHAGTEVVTDIIFLKKRMPGEEMAGETWMDLSEVQTEEGPTNVNEYFARHPEMVLGKHSLQGTMYRSNSYTVLPMDGNIEDHFIKAIGNLPKNVYSPMAVLNASEIKERVIERDYNPKNRLEGGLYISDDGTLMSVESGSGVPADSIHKLSPKDSTWLKDYCALRDAVKQAHYDQITDGDWESSYKNLQKAYNSFVKKNGSINKFTSSTRTETDEEGKEYTVEVRRYVNEKYFKYDPEAPKVWALEKIDDAGKIVKGPALTGRMVEKPKPPEVKSVPDALAVCLDQKGKLDLDHVAKLSNVSKDEAIEALGSLIYEEPGGGYLLADEYLSGDVVKKLEEARKAADLDPKYKRNVEVLSQSQPIPLTPDKITVNLGAPWVPLDYYTEFAKEVIGLRSMEVNHDPRDNRWSVSQGESESSYYSRRKKKVGAHGLRGNLGEWGTVDRGPNEILEAVLNGMPLKITRIDENKKTYTDEAATAQVNEVAKNMRQRFKSWVWEDAERAGDLLNTYNRNYNNLVGRKFDGSHLTLPGVSLHFKLHDHQKRAIWRVLQTGNTYLAHAVGSGKTIEMIASGMEMKRLGMISKPMYIVPNHMLQQFSSEFTQLYPLANVMVADEENFHTTNRRRFVAQEALNNPDAVIMTHSSFGKLMLQKENVQPITDSFLQDMRDSLQEMEEAGDISKSRLKQMESRIEKAEQRFDSLIAPEGKDTAITFEEMGVDFLFVDEAHQFRKLDFTSNRQVKGVTPEGSKRAMDLYLKTLWLDGKNPGRSFVFASGTPITNTMGELYTLMRFFDRNQMEADGINHFDSWANMFGSISPEAEMNAAGRYELVERFARFENVPELMSRVRTFMDVLTSSQLGAFVTRPDVQGGSPEVVITPPSESLKEYQDKVLAPRIETSKKWKPSRYEKGNPDPIINIITDGRLASIDTRYVRSGEANNPGSKLNQYIDGIIKSWNDTKGNTYIDPVTGKEEPLKGGTIICFYNHGFGEGVARRGFNAKEWMNKRFKEEGIPTREVVWIDDLKNSTDKQNAYRAMREGKVRLLIGSAKKMGTGLNVQRRLAALHYLDPPWYPSDVEQPDGRILRQGNLNKEVVIKRYATKGSYDATMWQMVARKQRMIDQAFSGDASVRSIEDLSETSQYQMAAALASGDERIVKMVNLNARIESLSRLQEAHHTDQIRLRNEREHAKDSIVRLKEMAKDYAKASDKVGGYVREIDGRVGKQSFDKRHDLGEALVDAFNQASTEMQKINTGKRTPREIGKLNGFSVTVEPILTADRQFYVNINITDKVSKSFGPFDQIGENQSREGLVTSMVNFMNTLDTQKSKYEESIREHENTIKLADKKIGAPFPHAQELNEATAEAHQIEAELLTEGQTIDEIAAAQAVDEAKAEAQEREIETSEKVPGGKLYRTQPQRITPATMFPRDKKARPPAITNDGYLVSPYRTWLIKKDLTPESFMRKAEDEGLEHSETLNAGKIIDPLKDKQPISITYSHSLDSYNGEEFSEPIAIFEDSEGNKHYYNDKYMSFFMKTLPNAEFRAYEKGPTVVYLEDDVAGLVMGITDGEKVEADRIQKGGAKDTSVTLGSGLGALQPLYESAAVKVKSYFQSKGIGEPPKKSKTSLFARNVARAIQVRPREILKKEAPQSSKEPIRKYEQTISDERRFAGNWMSEFDQSIESLSHADKKWIRENFKDAYENGVRMPNPRIQRFMQAWDKIQNEVGDKAIDLGIQEKYRTSEYVVKKGIRSVRVFDTKKEAETFIKDAKSPEGLEMTSRDAVKVRPFTKIRNYFPHTLTPEAREALRTQRGEVFDALQAKAHTEGFDLAPYMEDVDIKNMVRRNANLENARQARLPNFVETSTGRVQILETNPFKVLPNVIEGASRRLAFAKNWGPKPGEALKMHEEIRNSITRESGSENAFVWDYLWQDMQGRTLDEFFEGMTGDIKGFLYSAEAISRGLMLSSAQISNIITGPLPGMVKFGAWNMTKAGARLISQKLAKRLGVPMPETEALLEQFRREGGWSKETMKVTGETEDIGKSVAGIADTFLKKTGMEAANRFLNKMSNFASHYALEDAIEGLRKPRLGTFRKAWGMDPKGLKEFLKREGEWTDSDIDRIIKSGLTEEDHARFIQKSSTNTNVFMERANTRPSFMKNGFWRRVFSYTSYYRMMGSVVADTMKYAKEGNYRPLVTLLLAAPVLGMAEKHLKEYLKGVILQADEKKDEALTFAGQLLDAIAGAGALGFPGAMLSNLKWWTKRGGAPLTFPQAEWWGKVTYGMYNAVVKGIEKSPDEGAKQAYYTTIKNVPIFREIDNMLGGPYTQSLEKYRHGGHRQRRSRSHRRTSR